MLAGQIKSLVHGIQLNPTRILNRRIRHQYLANHRHRLQCNLTQYVRTHRHVAPTHHAQVQRSQTSLNHAFRPRLLARQKHHTDAKFFARIEVRASRFQQKAFRNPRQYSNSVAALAIGSHGSAMRQPRQCRQGLAQNVVTRFPQRGRNKSHTARIVLHARVDQRRIAIGIRHAAAQCCRCWCWHPLRRGGLAFFSLKLVHSSIYVASLPDENLHRFPQINSPSKLEALDDVLLNIYT